MRKYILVVPKFGSRISGIMEDVCFPSLFFQFSLNQCLTYIMEKEKKNLAAKILNLHIVLLFLENPFLPLTYLTWPPLTPQATSLP